MKTREKIMGGWLAACAGAILLVLVATTALQSANALSTANSVGVHLTPGADTNSGTPVAVTTALPPIPLQPGNMVGLTMEEIGERVLEDVQQRGMIASGTPEIRLIQNVAPDDLPELGLDCLTDVGTIEQVPYVLVILEGNIIPPGTQRFSGGRYLSLVYDLWAGIATSWRYSADGSAFKVALNDPTLPDPDVAPVTDCPGYAGPLFHYGDVRPTSVPMTPLAIESPSPTEVVPTAVATYEATMTVP